MPLTFPIDRDTQRFDIWDTDTNAFATREKDGVVSDVTNIRWPRADGGPIQDLPANIVPLLRQNDPDPVPSATQRLGPVGEPVVDLVEQTSTYTRTVVDLTAEELQARADAEADATERTQVRAVLLAMRDGDGTAGERLTRVERVLFRVAKDLLGDA